MASNTWDITPVTTEVASKATPADGGPVIDLKSVLLVDADSGSTSTKTVAGIGAWTLDAANGPYNAVIEWPARYNWRVTDFQTPPLEDMVVYQLHIGTYAGRNDPLGAASNPGTYLDVAKRIGHLADLGVNAVMINPVTEFPGDLSAGYNPITQWSPMITSSRR